MLGRHTSTGILAPTDVFEQWLEEQDGIELAVLVLVGVVGCSTVHLVCGVDAIVWQSTCDCKARRARHR